MKSALINTKKIKKNYMQKSVYIYSDKGVSKFSLGCFTKRFKELDIPIKLICSAELINTFWEASALALIMPGGRDIPYLEKLSGKGNQKIREYVEGGGSYLGVCAGAYYGADYVEFDKNSPLEVLGKRELKFTESKAVGPAYKEPRFEYNSHNGAGASLISYKSQNIDTSCHMYFNGGCFFENPDEKEVIGKYLDLRLSAILRKRVKKGKVVLSGVHFECFYDDLEATSAGKDLLEKLFQSEKQRKEIFKDIICYLISGVCLQVNRRPVF